MPERKQLIDYAPYLFAFVGVTLLLFAGYVAGDDELTCARQRDHVDCRLVNHRLLSLAVMGREDIPDVVASFISTTTSPRADQPADATFKLVTVNDALVLRTRQGADVVTLGGEPATDFARELETLLQGGGPKTLVKANSY